jgi:hypothetical protein
LTGGVWFGCRIHAFTGDGLGQREAICTAFGWSYDDLSEYQPTRRMHSRTFLYEVNNGYCVALRERQAMPRVYREMAEWRTVEVRNGWAVMETTAMRIADAA